MPNVTSLPKRTELHFVGEVLETWARVTEDGEVASFELVEMSDVLGEHLLFDRAVVSEHAVTQAMPRATDPAYVGKLVAVHQARMSVLPDVA
jgi:hypothetical protein